MQKWYRLILQAINPTCFPKLRNNFNTVNLPYRRIETKSFCLFFSADHFPKKFSLKSNLLFNPEFVILCLGEWVWSFLAHWLNQFFWFFINFNFGSRSLIIFPSLDWYDVVQISVYNLQTESGDPHASFVTLKAIQHFVDANWDRLCTGRSHFLFYSLQIHIISCLLRSPRETDLLCSLFKDSKCGMIPFNELTVNSKSAICELIINFKRPHKDYDMEEYYCQNT